MKISIIAPDIWKKDAVGNFCLDLSELLEENGINTSLYAQNFSKDETSNVNQIEDLFATVTEEDILLLSYSIYDKYLEQILEFKNKKICYFHGVTPDYLLEEFEPITAELCRKSIEQFPLLDKFDKLIANSEFIAHNLENYVNKKVDVLPPVFPSRYIFSNINIEENKNSDFLVVGRVVPHKKIENSISLFIKIKEIIPDAKLKIIGNMPNHIYSEFLKNEANKSGFNDSIEFNGIISDEELQQLYSKSFGFINTSLHEGFCIPVLEALYYGLTIFVQNGHAAEELIPRELIPINSNNIDSIDFEELLRKNKNEDSDYVFNVLNKNNINVWLEVLKLGDNNE